jgi:hypothetical protein
MCVIKLRIQHSVGGEFGILTDVEEGLSRYFLVLGLGVEHLRLLLCASILD